ncbi:hypothetical protein Tco_0059277 [Tanacetum coccineum]
MYKNHDNAPKNILNLSVITNLSSYDSVFISEVPVLEPNQDNSILYNGVQEMYYSEQPSFDPASDIEITSDRNIIAYDQYLKETESAAVQNTASTEQPNDVIMPVVDEITNQVAKYNAESIKNKNAHESLTAKLERYKERLVVPPTPVKIEVSSELPKAAKERTTTLAITEGSWGFEDIKDVFITQVIPFLNSLRESFKDFDNGLHNELNEVNTVFNQMEAVVEQCSVDKKCFEIQKKELLLEND